MEEQEAGQFRGPCLQGHTDATLVQNLGCSEPHSLGQPRTPASPALPLLRGHKDKNTRQQQWQHTFIEHGLPPALS